MADESVASYFPHCGRPQMKELLGNGPLFDRMFEVASTVQALKKRQGVVIEKIESYEAAVFELETKLQSLRHELVDLTTLEERARASLPGVPLDKINVYEVFSTQQNGTSGGSSGIKFLELVSERTPDKNCA
jgi:hypothetical protein